MKRERTDLLMKRKDHSEKEKELLKKIKTEHSLFRCKMLLCPAEELYNSCRMICFYECLYEYFRYCEKINVDFIHASDKEEWVLEQLWNLYLENEYLKADTSFMRNFPFFCYFGKNIRKCAVIKRQMLL